MNKIVQDLEDFVLPEKAAEPERDQITKQKIIDLLYKLYDFAEKND